MPKSNPHQLISRRVAIMVVRLLLGQNTPTKTDHQKRVEVGDPKILATREWKERATAKKKENKRQGGDGGERSCPATKEDLSPRMSPHGSADRSVHNYSDARHDDEDADALRLGTSGEHPIATQTSSPPRSIQRGNVGGGESSRGGPLYVPEWSIHQRCRLDTPTWSRELMVHLAPLTAQEESNALNNATALERAWFSLARGALAHNEILESLPEPFNLAIQAGCGKGLAKERSEGDLLALMGRMEGFDAYADTKMKVEYDKMFEKRYSYAKKISRGFRHSVSDLLKVYSDSSPFVQAPPSEPSFRQAASTTAPLGS
uniref:Uncharacterized protein n=1 Tax=Tanacetum cinerariifolium TaxID=118510 RepID=A0A6L2JXI8_TANCI|nr:hypothetical protein [Tanacetum cinerariifolium]